MKVVVSRVSDQDSSTQLDASKSTSHRPLPIFNTTYDGIPAYDPGDLFVAHKSKKNHFAVFGRSNDQIMLGTGEIVCLQSSIPQYQPINADFP